MLRNLSKYWNRLKAFAFIIIVTIGSLSLLSTSNAPWRTPLKPFIVLSGSMRPTISEGSIVFVKRRFTNLKVGDIVTFIEPKKARQNITHRIVKKLTINKKIFYLTKGDANKSNDLWMIQHESVWGKVVFTLPLAGYILSFSKTKPGVIILVVIPMIIIAFDEIRIIFLELKKRKTKIPVQTLFVFIFFFLLINHNLLYFNYSNASFTDFITLSNQQITTYCWVAPTAPSLNSPANDTVSSQINITFDWNTTPSSCPVATIEYNFQTYSDTGLTTLILESGFSNNLIYTYNNIPEGQYWWRAQAKDQYGNLSSSTANHLTVDRTAPLTPTMTITGSFTKAVEEKVNNGDLATGDLTGWTTAGNVQLLTVDSVSNPSTTVSPYGGSTNMVKIGNSDDPGNYVWENRLMQSFDSGAKALSLNYNFFSRDYSPNHQPGFFIRLDGQEVFKQNNLESDGTNALNTGWQQFYYNLSGQNDAKVNLSIDAGNTGDTSNQSWVYVDKITTYFVSAPSDAKYYLSGNDNPGGSGINHFEYSLDGSTWFSIPVSGYFQLLTEGDRMIYYRSVDNAGNYTAAVPVRVITDTTSPSFISDLAVSETTVNSVTLTWTAPGNDGTSGRAVSYDVRYSTTNITDDASFNSAAEVDKVPSPQTAESTETLEILGLNPSTTYYFAIKSSDEAPNTSSLSNVPSTTTLAGPTVNPGDIIINELMWTGTKASTDDQYIELRNMTDHEIDLGNFTIDKFDGSADVLMLTIPAGKTIAAKGYLLISNFASNASDLKDSISVDYETTDIDLSATNLSIKLYDADSNKIDEAWNGTAPTEGFYDTTVGSEKYYSMERTSVPGDGTKPLNWYTCIETASTTDFFDGGADERGTPGAENRSENEPLAHQKEFVTPEVTESPSPTPTIIKSPSEPTETPQPTTEPTQEPLPTPSPVEPSPEISS